GSTSETRRGLTVPGVVFSVESSLSGLMRTTKRGCYVRRLSQPSPFQMGLQVSRSVRAQTTTESDLRPIPGPTGRDLPRTGEAEGVSDCGRTPHARPCAHVHRDSTQAPGRLRNRVFKGEERHRPPRRKGEELLG